MGRGEAFLGARVGFWWVCFSGMYRVIFHVDMDAFFASVEQRDYPEYRGLPVVVGAPPDRRGVVCAASYEARKFQVRSAMPSRTAQRLCPEAIFLRPRMEVYRAESRKIMEIFRSLTERVEPVSVDEAYLDMSFLGQRCASADVALESALPMARHLKRRIFEERGLTASVGVGSNKFLAKLGSDFSKPDGLTCIRESEKVAFLRPLSVRSIPGVGPVTAQALEARGYATIGDLQGAGAGLESVVGSWAAKLRARAWGEDEREVEEGRERKSVSAEHTFSRDTEDRGLLRGVLRELAEEVARSLERHRSGALTVQVKVRYSDFKTLTRQIRVEEPVLGSREIYRLSCHLLAVHGLVDRPLRLLGVGVSTLVAPGSLQLRLPI